MFVVRNIIEICLVIASVVIFLSCVGRVTSVFVGDSGTLPERTFMAFVSDIKEFSAGNNFDDRKGSELFLEDGQAVVYFQPNKDKMTVFVDSNWEGGTTNKYLTTIRKPSSCTDEACLCFVKEKTIETKTDVDFTILLGPLWADLETAAFVDLTNVKCSDIPKLSLDVCSIGIPNQALPYVCTDGFVIERHLMKEVEESFISAFVLYNIYYTTPQNLVVTLSHETDSVKIEPRVIAQEGARKEVQIEK